MKITRHLRTTPDCGAVGPIVYEKGKAWSVNAKVVDWRFELDYLPKGCDRHIQAAKEANESTVR